MSFFLKPLPSCESHFPKNWLARSPGTTTCQTQWLIPVFFLNSNLQQHNWILIPSWEILHLLLVFLHLRGSSSLVYLLEPPLLDCCMIICPGSVTELSFYNSILLLDNTTTPYFMYCSSTSLPKSWSLKIKCLFNTWHLKLFTSILDFTSLPNLLLQQWK